MTIKGAKMPAVMTKVLIVQYPGALKSSIYGLEEMLLLAAHIQLQNTENECISAQIVSVEDIKEGLADKTGTNEKISAVIIPPSIETEYYLAPDEELLFWLKKLHDKGIIICSACAGAFIVGASGIFKDRRITTHWALSNDFKSKFPMVKVEEENILINEGDIITAGGLMAWVDLGLELIAQLISPEVMRQLGKQLVVDTGKREQRYYQSFIPGYDHKDKNIIKAQKYIWENYSAAISNSDLSELVCMSVRNFIRRFSKATGMNPKDYLQRVRVQKACNLLEGSDASFEKISYKVGYQNVSSFRKVFFKIMGLTPSDFRKRFS